MSSLFSPLTLRKLLLNNRIIVSPMCQYSAVEGNATSWHTVHLGQLAMSGAGMLMLEATAVEDIGRITPSCLGLYSKSNIAALNTVLEDLQPANQQTRTPICIQLAHAGRKGSSFEPWNSGQQIPLEQGGWQAVAPSAIPHLSSEMPPKALSLDEMKKLKQKFVDTTIQSDRLGIDAVELHAAHGYLLHQYLSPIANQRQDQYGGSLENRMRYPLEILQEMRQALPDHKPLGIRLSASDWDVKSSWDIEESIVFAQHCVQCGADWIDVSSGGVSEHQTIKLEPGYQVAFAAAIKKSVDIPVMAVGLITEARQAENIINSKQADMVALARGFLYNPRWVWHAAAELGASVAAPKQYWRSQPHNVKELFQDASIGQR